MTAASPAAAIRRQELSGFLKARRADLRPADVGIEPGPRRRTPGLRREEVALLAGVGVTWYTWLEQGRDINASWQVLDAVAGALRLDSTERWHLYRLAEATPVRPPRGEIEIPEHVLAIVDGLDPLPASLVDHRFNILAINAASEALYVDWHSLPCVHFNLLWCCVTEPRARDRMSNYDEVIPHLVARLRSGYAQHLDDPEWTEEIRRLAELSPEFRRLWARHEVTGPLSLVRRYVHPEVGEVALRMTELEVSGLPQTRIMVSTPVDEAARAALTRTR